jgi:hypothetical protein
MKRRLIALLVAALMAMSLGAPAAFAAGDDGGGGFDGKCNAGRGNASEGDPDCDPGNSGGNNQGGD